MSQTPGIRPNTLFPDTAAPETPQQLSNQDLWSGYTPNLQSGSWVNIQAPTRHESGTNYLLSRQANLASFVNQLQNDFGAPQGVATAPWQQQQMGLAARDLGITATGIGSGSLQNSPGAAGVGNPAGGHNNLSQEEQAVLHSLLARAGIRLPGTANVAGMNAPSASPQAAGLLEPTPFTISSGTTRASAEAAAQSITGKKAKIWMRTLAEQIQSRSALELTPAGVAQAVHKMHGLDNRPCPSWDGNNPGDTFRSWIQEQTHWLILTNKRYEFWGIMLYDALSGTPKKHAKKVPEGVRLSYQGYGAIARVLIQEYSGYLEIEFEVSVIRVLHNFPSRKKDEMYTHFISKCQMLFDDLDEQLFPEKFNDKIKAVMLLHSANLTEQQQIQLSLKRAGSQTWEELTPLLRMLDRPQQFLHASQIVFGKEKPKHGVYMLDGLGASDHHSAGNPAGFQPLASPPQPLAIGWSPGPAVQLEDDDAQDDSELDVFAMMQTDDGAKAVEIFVEELLDDAFPDSETDEEGEAMVEPDRENGEQADEYEEIDTVQILSLIHISEPTRPY